MTISSSDDFINTGYSEFLIKKDNIKNLSELSIELMDDNWKNIFSSQIAFNDKNFSKSKELALTVLNNRDTNSCLLNAEAYNLLGRIARLYQLEEDAKGFYESAMANFVKDSSFWGHLGSIRLEFNMANILLLNSELSKALISYDALLEKMSLTKPEKNFDKDYDKLKVKIYQNKALTLLYLGKSDESKENFEKAIELVSSVSGTSTEADLYLNYTNLTIIKEDFDLTYSLLDKAGSLYRKLGKNDIASKIEIDKIKIDLINGKENLIDPIFVSNLISLYEKATGKDVSLRIIEILELLYSQGKFDETKELLNYLQQKDFLPDLKGRILFIAMNLKSYEGKFKDVISIGKELLEITNFLKDDESILPINILLAKAKFMLDNKKDEMLKALKHNVNQLLKQKEVESAIIVYEEYFSILFPKHEYSFIIEILEEVEGLVLKKVKDDNIKEFHENDLILLFALTENDKSKKIFLKVNRPFSQVLENSRYKTLLSQNKDLENKIKEYLEIA